MSKYVAIIEEDPAPKTKRWKMMNVRTNERCGTIRWSRAWGKYVFFPTDGFMFDAECLQTLSWFLVKANVEHKSAPL